MNIKFTSNAQNIAMRLRLAQKAIQKATINTPLQAAQEGRKFARMIAPKKTNYLREHIKAIRGKKKGKSYGSATLQSYTPPVLRKGTKGYHLWVNENIKYIWLAGKRRTYRSTRHTGKPGYFNLTLKYLIKKYPVLMSKNINRGLRILARGG